MEIISHVFSISIYLIVLKPAGATVDEALKMMLQCLSKVPNNKQMQNMYNLHEDQHMWSVVMATVRISTEDVNIDTANQLDN